MKVLYSIVITVLFILYISIVSMLCPAHSDKACYDNTTTIENEIEDYDYITLHDMNLSANVVCDSNLIFYRISTQLRNLVRFSKKQIFSFIKMQISQFAIRHTIKTHCHLQLFNLPFYSSSQPSCHYYVFAMRRILD